MKKRKIVTQTAISAAWILIPCFALAQHDQLSLKHGSYVQKGVPCKDAPFAVMKSWDGVGFFGPHSSRCTTRVLSHHGNKFNTSTTCTAIGDGTPLPSGPADVETLSLIRLSNTLFTTSPANQPQATTYRWCSADVGTGNFPKGKP